jgi:hypothetical protein|tara:strand:+ start:262 stop:438 length:177 start_codon:yes stop_codon:yes gene_type:complete
MIPSKQVFELILNLCYAARELLTSIQDAEQDKDAEGNEFEDIKGVRETLEILEKELGL